MPARPPGRRLLRKRGEAGYNLVILAIAVTVMTILVTAALPSWSHQIRRDKEEELRFRGLQYAEAIRIFQARFGRLPVRLEELIEVKPRSIRKLWRDPMTESGKWGLVFAGVGPGAQNAGQNVGQNAPLQATLAVGDAGEDENGRTVTVGPIRGVFSRSDKESIASFMGQQNYNKWIFTPDLLQGGPAGRAGGGVAPGQAAAPGQPALIPMQWIGRPFRSFLQQQMPVGGAGPGNLAPGGRQPGNPAGSAQPKVDSSGRPIE